MTDDLKERLLDNALTAHRAGKAVGGLLHEALSYITDLEAKLQRLGRELNLAKYGEPDFAWETHKNAVADLEARLAAAEAGENALAKAGSEARIALAGMVRPYNAVNLLDAALAAYEARRKG